MKYRDIFIVCLLAALVIYAACNRQSEGSKNASLKIKVLTTADIETDPVPQDKNEDSADDPAIWIDSENPTNSKIIGTNKKGGLAVYDLNGKQVFYTPSGKMNNVDLRYGFVLGNDTIDIIAASNRTTHSFNIYKISKDGILSDIGSSSIQSELIDDVYGFCMYKSPLSGKYYAFMNSKAGEVEQWELVAVNDSINAKIVRSFKLNTQTEGMVADDKTGIIYIGEEIKGIWKFNAEPETDTIGVMIALSDENNKNIRYDVEGIDIYYASDSTGYLIASSQGNYSYAVFKREDDNQYLGSFRIVDGKIDGAEETDGLAVCNLKLNDNFSKGIFVVQDGFNYDDEGKDIAQNFKYVKWEKVASLFDSALEVNPSYQPF